MADHLTCRGFVNSIDDYLTGELAASVLAECERHLAACPPCIDYLKTFRATLDLVRASKNEAAAVPEELIRAILASLAAATPPGAERPKPN